MADDELQQPEGLVRSEASLVRKRADDDSPEEVSNALLEQTREADKTRKYVAIGIAVVASLFASAAMVGLLSAEKDDLLVRAVLMLAAGSVVAAALRAVDRLTLPIDQRLTLERIRANRPETLRRNQVKETQFGSCGDRVRD